MSERPILFSAEMARAILDGGKTQTRRLSGLEEVNNYTGSLSGETIQGFGDTGYKGLMPSDYYIRPYYKSQYKNNPKQFHWFLGEKEREINPIPVKCPYGVPGDRLWVRETFSYGEQTRYRADLGLMVWHDTDQKWSPSIFMPRWASRIDLLIKDIRVERVQDITPSDARAEGAETVENYILLWDKLNAKRGYGWDVNPYVWVIEFEVMKWLS